MTYLIKYFLRLLLLSTLFTLTTEILRTLYLQHTVNPDTFWPGLSTHLSNAFNTTMSNFISLNISDFLVVHWTWWLFSNKPYYIVLLLVGCILYYKMRQNKLTQPLIITHKTTPLDRYEQQKKQNTQRQVRKLKESPQFMKYKRAVLFNKLPQKEDDETIAQLRQKENQLF